jgi:hypothetical protein
MNIQGGIAGVASTLERSGIKLYNERDKYNEWEFIYDLTKDQSRGGAMAGMAGQGMTGQGLTGQQSGQSPQTGPGFSPPFGSQPQGPGGFGSQPGPAQIQQPGFGQQPPFPQAPATRSR